jgi:hypothetical protein
MVKGIVILGLIPPLLFLPWIAVVAVTAAQKNFCVDVI